MKPELRAKIIAYNKAMKERSKKARDMDTLVAQLQQLPGGQLKKVLSREILALLAEYGVGA